MVVESFGVDRGCRGSAFCEGWRSVTCGYGWRGRASSSMPRLAAPHSSSIATTFCIARTSITLFVVHVEVS